MKKIVIKISLLLSVFYIYAQEKNDKASQEWYHKSYEQTKTPGVGTEEAINFLKTKGLKPTTIVVGVVDSGVEIDHEDLKDNIWKNPKEIPNNKKDDDGNGYIDDINGWDFIGGKDGKDVDKDTYEATRITKKYNDIFNGSDSKKNVENIKKMPEEYNLYLKARSKWAEEYYSSKDAMDNLNTEKENVLGVFSSLKDYAKDIKLIPTNINTLPTSNDMQTRMKKQLLYIVENNPQFEGKTMNEVFEEVKKDFKKQEDRYNDNINYAYSLDYDSRKIIGDNYNNLTEKDYGNNEVEGPDAFHGTHVSGIIAANRKNDKGIKGIAGDVAKILVVRAVPDGDERDKDIANGIRYAVDNGAKIINMSFGKSLSPDKEIVREAIKYADSKGVLMVHAAGNDNKDLDNSTNYPSNYYDESYIPYVKNWITVGASTESLDGIKASFSNFGTAKIDLYAPGSRIYSTIINNKYDFADGTSMASPVVAGCAALLWAYFPQLSATEVKDLLLSTVNVIDENVMVGTQQDRKNFKNISVTGGIVDVSKAVKMAYEKYGTK